jgi:(1->4)-alpha-D-glucan 1-alpha-D-glucosylmutase
MPAAGPGRPTSPGRPTGLEGPAGERPVGKRPSGERPRHHLAKGTVVPASTYRLQLHAGFTFDDAAAQADYLAALGISHLYLSPILEGAPGSAHGYDVVDPTQVSAALGGRAGFDRLVEELRARGLGVILDVVPNHMAVPVPEWRNVALWSVLRDGPDSPHAAWFDIDWATLDGQLLMPVLADEPDQLLASGGIRLARDGGRAGAELVLRQGDHEFPVRPGSESLPMPDLLAAQAYRLASWHDIERVNYRRFFDVTSLIAVRVEDPAVFEATHALVLELVRSGQVDGLRIDHPDGLADPAGYLERLGEATGGTWVLVEKILEGEEELPDGWRCAGTTGYDQLRQVQHLFLDPRGDGPLTELYAGLAGHPVDLTEEVLAAKQQVVDQVLVPEVERLVRLVHTVAPDLPGPSVRRAVKALLVSMDRYRVYDPGHHGAALAVLDEAVERAGAHLAEPDHPALGVLRDLAAGRDVTGPAGDHVAAVAEFATRFEQTCGPVMGKGLEDTAFYRHTRLLSVNEVGGDPSRVGIEPRQFHAHAQRTLAVWPTTMTTLSTHDTKRSEDVRARLAVLAERPAAWAAWLAEARCQAGPFRHPRLDPGTEYLLWQTLAGAWPLSAERLQAYAVKAVREAKVHTSWTDPDQPYESAVMGFVAGVTGHAASTAHLDDWVAQTADSTRATVLGQKLVQLVMPGVPDVYQGTELVDLSLVDPDNRRPVDFADRTARLARLDAGWSPRDLSDEKLLVTSRALRLRRSHPQWFWEDGATYAPLTTSTDHAVALARGDASGPALVAVVTRFPGRLEESGGWQDHTVSLPSGEWGDVLVHRDVSCTGSVRLRELLTDLPVALLLRRPA